ncbi:unnamed protein product [Polarella glacialis]|uniref:Uncharacterized protein n=1 Tax=Polarella glacialis TaxID=89957 RepID=A0A813JHF0_POLGL|nr:unnamed protein product [Polarella glacialis]
MTCKSTNCVNRSSLRKRSVIIWSGIASKTRSGNDKGYAADGRDSMCVSVWLEFVPVCAGFIASVAKDFLFHLSASMCAETMNRPEPPPRTRGLPSIPSAAPGSPCRGGSSLPRNFRLKPQLVHGNKMQTSAEELAPGNMVRIQGLSGATHLNGTECVLVGFEPGAGRWHVRLAGGETVGIKVDNLQRAPRSNEAPKYAGSPAPPPPMGSSTGICAGHTVRLHGLLGASHLNGAVAVIEGFDAETQRWRVTLTGGQVKAVRLENLEALGGPARAASPTSPCGVTRLVAGPKLVVGPEPAFAPRFAGKMLRKERF